MADKLLIIESDRDVREDLTRYYTKKGWQTEMAVNVGEVRRTLLDDEFNPHVIIADPGLLDNDIPHRMKQLDEQIDHSEWIFVFEAGGRSHSKPINEFAYDCLEKPIDQKHLDIILQRALRASQTARRLKNYSAADLQRYNLDAYVGASKQVRELKSMLKKLMQVPISAMIISGETGTGKGLVARILHHCGMRKEGPLVELNCAALPKELLESQLFGHEAGAFTGAKGRHRGLLEQADGGTLFLDEIGDMDLDLQSKLLKAIEDKRIRRLGGEREIEIDVQIIAATGVNLEQAVQKSQFRQDLYHRLSVFRVTLPPLRDHKSDLVELVPRIIVEFNAKANKRVETVSDDVWEQMLAYDWPGNVRELRNVIERCVLLSTDDEFPAGWLQLSDTSQKPAPPQIRSDNTVAIPLDGSMSLDEMDSYIIQTALQQNHFNITETARVLGTTRETLRYRIQKYDLKTTEQ